MPKRTYETPAEAAIRLGVHINTVRRRIADGSLTGYRLGPRLVKLDPDEVDALILGRAIPSARTVA